MKLGRSTIAPVLPMMGFRHIPLAARAVRLHQLRRRKGHANGCSLLLALATALAPAAIRGVSDGSNARRASRAVCVNRRNEMTLWKEGAFPAEI